MLFKHIAAIIFLISNQAIAAECEKYSISCNKESHRLTTSQQMEDQFQLFVKCRIKSKQEDEGEECLSAAGVVDPGEDARQKARDGMRSCIANRALALDDQISPIFDISKIIASGCKSQWSSYVDSFYALDVTKEEMKKDMWKYFSEQLSEHVLSIRNARSEKMQKSGKR